MTVLRKHDKGMSVIQCKHCHHVFVGGPFRIRAHLLGLKGSGVDKCRHIDAAIKAEVQKMVSDITSANVDVKMESAMECKAENSIANIDVNVESTSITEMPSSSFVIASTSKKMKVDNAEPLKVSWQKQLDKNADEAIRRFFFVEDVPDVKVGSAYFHDMIKAIALVGPSYKPPSPNQLHRRHLNE